jgi:hypothetical protein
MGRSTSGVRAISVPEGDRLVSMAWVRPAGGNGGEADAAESSPLRSPQGETPVPPLRSPRGETPAASMPEERPPEPPVEDGAAGA